MKSNYKEEIEKILPVVSRPARYINHEWNSTHKDSPEGRASLCLCFPDIYELGISNLGIEILYHCVNQHDEFVAERCYCPDLDMQQKMREHNIPLCSLESFRPLKYFDVIGFSLQHELCYTNVLHMLDCAGIAKKARDRTDTFPLIIGGGPCTANPEPMAEFFDAFVLGDGETVIIEIMDWIAGCRSDQKLSKDDILRGLSRIKGVYVPSLYEVTYQDSGIIDSIRPCQEGINAVVERQLVDLENASYPERPIVPFIHAVQDRLSVEIARGCIHRCRFCQASFTKRPVRERSVEKVLSIVEKGLRSTGFEEVSLSALSCSDYSHIETLVDKLVQRFAKDRIALSLPSLRCNERSLALAQRTRGVKKSSLTFAPEAGTERMRTIIHKKMDNEDIIDVMGKAYAYGWKHVKLYFMYGLPWESTRDIDGIIALVKHAKKAYPKLNYNITVSPFVPKAHTPFQWCPQEDIQTLVTKRSYLIKKLPGHVRTHPVETAWLEGIFARGDRRLSAVILAAQEQGCSFDQWKERYRHDLWKRSFEECGIDPDFYCARERKPDEVFPWDHLQYSLKKRDLYDEYLKSAHYAAIDQMVSLPEKEKTPPRFYAPWPRVQATSPSRSVQRVRLRFRRSGPARFLSHLEQITAFRRMLRRTGLPLAFTHGFHPQPKISFGPAISVGYSSDAEYIDIELVNRVNPEVIRDRISAEIPPGFGLMSSKQIPVFFPSLDAVLNRVSYRINGLWPEHTRDRIESFLGKKEYWIEKIKKNNRESVNLTPLIHKMLLHNSTLDLLMDFGPKKNIKPTLLIRELFDIPEKEVETFQVHKVALYIHRHNQGTIEP